MEKTGPGDLREIDFDKLNRIAARPNSLKIEGPRVDHLALCAYVTGALDSEEKTEQITALILQYANWHEAFLEVFKEVSAYDDQEEIGRAHV